MKNYETLNMIFRLFNRPNDPHSESWLSEMLRRHTNFRLKKLGLPIEEV